MQPVGSNRRNPTTVLVFGASARAGAESARRGGYSVVAIDQFGDRDTRRVAEEFHLVADGLEGVCGLMEDVRRRHRSIETVQVGDMPGLVDCEFAQPARKTPQERLAVVGQSGIFIPQNLNRLQHPSGIRWLGKTRRSSGGLGVRWIRDMAPDCSDWREPFIAGRPIGISFLATSEAAYQLGACRIHHRRFGHLPFVYAGSSGPFAFEPEQNRMLERMAENFRRQNGFRGLFNADVLITEEGKLVLLEINPRYSASMEVLERVSGHFPSDSISAYDLESSLLHWHIAARDCDPCADKWAVRFAGRCRDSPFYVEKHIVYSRQSGEFSERKLRALQDQMMTAGPICVVADLPHDGQRIDVSMPLLTLICRSSRRGPRNSGKIRRRMRQLQECVNRV